MGSIPAGDIARKARGLANLRVVQSEGSIDLSVPTPRPCGLRPCRSLPSGSVPAGDISPHGGGLVNLGVVESEGSIDSVTAATSPLRGLRLSVSAPTDVFPPGTAFKWLDLGTGSTIPCALDELEGCTVYERICVCFGRPVLFAFVRHAISGEARTDAISCAAVFRSVFPFASHV